MFAMAGAMVATLQLGTYSDDAAQICRRVRSLLHEWICFPPCGDHPWGSRSSMADAPPEAGCSCTLEAASHALCQCALRGAESCPVFHPIHADHPQPRFTRIPAIWHVLAIHCFIDARHHPRLQVQARNACAGGQPPAHETHAPRKRRASGRTTPRHPRRRRLSHPQPRPAWSEHVPRR